MSAIPGFIYGFACGSTELSKIQKIYLLVTASCVYAIVAIFHIGCSLFQSRVDSCSQDTSTVRSFIDTTYSFVKIYVVGLLPIIATRKILIQESVRINTAPSLAEELKILFGKKLMIEEKKERCFYILETKTFGVQFTVKIIAKVSSQQ